MKTQYGEDVPDDLVLLPNPKDLMDLDLRVILAAEWYEYQGILLVSGSAIDWFSEGDPLDAGLDLSALEEIDRVAESLKRFSREDGFYHA